MSSLDEFIGAIRKLETPFDKAHNFVHVAGQVDNNNMLKRNARRMEAQVDAALKAKYKQCGMEGVYEPPDEEDDMGNTYINCPIIGNEGIRAIADASVEVPCGPGKKPWWYRLLFWLALLSAVIIGAILTADFFQGEPARYEVLGIPWNPNM
jgi:hypothetical protein